MENDLDDFTINEDSKYNKNLYQAKSKLQNTSKIAFGLDGNLKHEMGYDESNMFKNELDMEQQQLFEEEKQQKLQQQELLKLKPKLLNRFNKLTSLKKMDSNSEEKIMKYKKYLQNHDYYSSTEEYPLKKLKLLSHQCVNKHYIPLVESIMRDCLNRRTLDNITVVMICFSNYKKKLFKN